MLLLATRQGVLTCHWTLVALEGRSGSSTVDSRGAGQRCFQAHSASVTGISKAFLTPPGSYGRLRRSPLASGGILSFRVGSAENYISPELQQFLGCLDRTLREVFPDVAVVPGETNIFMACKEPGILTLDSDELVTRLEARGIKEDLLFIREYYLPFRLSEERKETLVSALATAKARTNTDLTPVCYYYDAVLWSKQFKDSSGAVLAGFSRVRPHWIAVAIAGAFAIALLIQRICPLAWGQKSILVAVGTTGFAEITIQVVTLLGFQAIHGYVYYKVAIIITAFMIGLTMGAAVMGRLMES